MSPKFQLFSLPLPLSLFLSLFFLFSIRIYALVVCGFFFCLCKCTCGWSFELTAKQIGWSKLKFNTRFKWRQRRMYMTNKPNEYNHKFDSVANIIIIIEYSAFVATVVVFVVRSNRSYTLPTLPISNGACLQFTVFFSAAAVASVWFCGFMQAINDFFWTQSMTIRVLQIKYMKLHRIFHSFTLPLVLSFSTCSSFIGILCAASVVYASECH